MDRFIEAQNNVTFSGLTVYERAIKEISSGYLSIHCWIRYLFPQLSGLGQSKVTKFYEIKSREEALEYIKEDEYLEVTPHHLRIRKIILDEIERKRQAKQQA